jgi:hypothetical protein
MEHVNLANNQFSHNRKFKSGKEIRQSNPPTSLPKICWHSTEWSVGKKKKGWKPLSSKKIIQYRIQWEMKKMDIQFLTSTKQQ